MNAETGTDKLLLTYRGTVYPWHLDHMDHMNIQYYMAKFDEAVWNLFHRIGLTPSYLRAENRGMAALETNVRYLEELFAGDVVAVHSGVLRVGETSLRFVQEMRNGETWETAAIMRVVAVHLDRAARCPVPFPEAIAARARALVVDYPEA
jgi:acyl-CoA thioester hydrolase